jgi:hypothetical protein
MVAVFLRYVSWYDVPGYRGQFPFVGFIRTAEEEEQNGGCDPMVRLIAEDDPQLKDPAANGAIVVQALEITAAHIAGVGNPDLDLVPGLLPNFLPAAVAFYLEHCGVLRKVTSLDGDGDDGLLAGVAYWSEYIAADNEDLGLEDGMGDSGSDGSGSDAGSDAGDFFPVGFYQVTVERS